MKRLLIPAAFAALVSLLAFQQFSSANTQSGPTIREFLGVNVVVDNTPADVAQVAGWARDYHKWMWYEGTKDVYSWATGWQQIDAFYSSLKALGMKVMPDVERAPDWAILPTPTPSGDPGRVPLRVPDPRQHAEYVEEMVRYFGDKIDAVENYNEPDNQGNSEWLSPQQFGETTALDRAAISSANPSLPMVLGGLSNANTTYQDRVNGASGGQYDVLNFHWYGMGDETNGGVNPESRNLFEQIDEMKAWQSAQGINKPLWITEFGWDTALGPNGERSKLYAPEASAANYLLRSVFLMMGHGVDKAFTFIYRDPTDNQDSLRYLFYSSGLVENQWPETDGRKKAGWYYLATLKSILGDYSLDGIVSAGPELYRYEVVMPGTNKRAAVMWVRSGERDDGYQKGYRGPAGLLVEPAYGSTSGNQAQTDGNLILTERPVFVLYEGDGPALSPTDTPTPRSTVAPSCQQ